MPRELHLALIHHQFGPYHIARARRLVETFPGRVTLVQLATSEKIRDWRGDPSGLPLETVATGMLESIPDHIVADGLAAVLARVSPSCLVISGYAHPAMRRAATWAKDARRKAILISDSQARDLRRNPLKELAKRMWVSRHFDAAFVSGATAAAYVESLGIPPHRIWRGYDVVDNQHFAARADDVRSRATALRSELGLPPKFLLYVGRFAPEKNLARLLAAFASLVAREPQRDHRLVMVGSGPEETSLKAQAEPLGERVLFPGFKQADELPSYYGLADAFLLPSLVEPWGLVINEAMASGLPIVASSQCGAVPDLVFPGLNGAVVNPHDVEDMRRTLSWITEDEPRRRAMGVASSRLIETFSIDNWCRALATSAAALA